MMLRHSFVLVLFFIVRVIALSGTLDSHRVMLIDALADSTVSQIRISQESLMCMSSIPLNEATRI